MHRVQSTAVSFYGLANGEVGQVQVYRVVTSAVQAANTNLRQRSKLRRLNVALHHILSLTGSLLVTTLVTSGVGFVFWWVAAHLFPPAAVGLAAAALSAMTLLGSISVLGLGTLLMGELQRRPQQSGALITTALVVAGTTGLVLGVVLAVVAPAVAPDLRSLARDVESVLLFALGVSLTAITLVLDQALIGLLRGTLQLARNTVFAVIKLVALLVAELGFASTISANRGMTIYVTWILGNVISLVFLAGLAVRTGKLPRLARPKWALLRGIERAALGHHALNLALQAPVLIMPVLVAAVLSVSAAAYFYTVSMLTSFLNYVPFALTLSLYTVSAVSPVDLPRAMRFTLGLAVLVGVIANGALVIGSGPVLSLFGATYAEHASACLRILGLSAFPIIIKDHYTAVARVRGRLVQAASLVIAGAVCEVLLAGLGAHLGGLTGLCAGWVIALCGEAAFMAPTVYRVAADVRTSNPQQRRGPRTSRRTTVPLQAPPAA